MPNLKPIGGTIESQDLNDNFSVLDEQLAQTGQQVGHIAFTNVDAHIGNDSAKLNSFLSAHAGKTVRIPRGIYNISTTVVVPANTEVEAEGVKLKSSSHIVILRVNSGVKLNGLEIEGAGNSTFNENGIAIEVSGGFNSGAISYKDEVVIENCHLHDLGSSGVYGEYARYVTIKNTRIERVGRNGILGDSVEHWQVSDCFIKGISPGSPSTVSGNNMAYGVAFSKKCFLGANATNEEILQDLLQYPKPKNCSVINSTIEDNLIWEALDTHSGENITFENNKIRNCARGIVATPISRRVNNETYFYHSPQNVHIKDNTIKGLKTQNGIAVAGASFTPATSVSREFAEGCIVEGNTLIDCGTAGDQFGGAIYVRDTRGLVISTNTLKNPLVFGINLHQTNLGFVVLGNTVIDPNDNVYTAPAGIVVRLTHNYGFIGDNNILKVDATINAFVGVRGLSMTATTDFDVTLGVNRSNCDQPQHNFVGDKVKHQTFGDGFRHTFVGFGEPTNIVARRGSIYINMNGGTGTTLYVKETGSAAGSIDGWVAK